MTLSKNINILSYSGGADSTALLVYCRENNVPYEEAVYSEDWFRYPGEYMRKYFDYIEKEFDIKIAWIKNDIKYWIEKNKGRLYAFPASRSSKS